MAPSVLFVGGNGLVGRPLVQTFLANKNRFDRFAVLTAPEKVERFADVKAQGAEIVVGSALEASSYKGFDTVICILGNLAMKLQPGIINAAIAGGVRHFYPSELGADFTIEDHPRIRFFRDKIITREHLRLRAKEVPGFKYTLVVTGAFAEFAASPFTGVDTQKHVARTYGRSDAKITVTSMPDILRFIVESVLIPLEAGTFERELRICGGNLTFGEVIQFVEEAQGVKYDVQFLDPKEMAVKEEEARKAGESEAEIMYSGVTLFASGKAFIPGPYANGLVDFEFEKPREAFKRLFGSK
ncbi:NAD(P)-binding protein [Favolaschia claudopus]|uniref:NAD(P)-binding protein n=1 Tax=Favolaschia claudopus TaxID=2862362 RepID=A0AAW0DW21_9AGAR